MKEARICFVHAEGNQKRPKKWELLTVVPENIKLQGRCVTYKDKEGKKIRIPDHRIRKIELILDEQEIPAIREKATEKRTFYYLDTFIEDWKSHKSYAWKYYSEGDGNRGQKGWLYFEDEYWMQFCTPAHKEIIIIPKDNLWHGDKEGWDD